MDRAGRVLHGTCGWSDPSLLRCGRFYPSSVKSAEDRLVHYSSHFPCVEVDSSCYAIPHKDTVTKWTKQVCKEFLFHFKAFGLFCGSAVQPNALPQVVRRDHFIPSDAPPLDVAALPPAAVDQCWTLFNEALAPAFTSNHLGLVLFQ